MRHVKLSLILVAAFLAAAYAAYRHPHLSRAQATDHTNKPPGPPESHRMVGPLFIQDDRFSSFLTLVDNTMTDLYADVVINAADGEQVAKTRVYFAGHGIKAIQLADILGAAASRVSYGSITIIPQESLALMPILAQVSMVGDADCLCRSSFGVQLHSFTKLRGSRWQDHGHRGDYRPIGRSTTNCSSVHTALAQSPNPCSCLL